MAGMFSLLGMGSRSFLSFQSGMASAGHNVANASTPGFRRTQVSLSSELAPPLGGGVRAGGMERVDDPRLSRREREATADLGQASDLAAAAAALEGAVNPEAGGLVDALSSFFTSIGEASASPTDPNRRAQVVQAGDTLAQIFRELQTSVRESIHESEERIQAYAETASRLADDLAKLNSEIGVNSDPTLQDRRDEVAGELASLTGGKVLEGDGGYRFMLDDGTVLVDGNRAAEVQAVPDPALAGQSRLDVVDGGNRHDVTAAVGGKLAGQLELRDRIAPALQGQVDQLAFDLAGEVNTIHSAHAGLDGVTGRDFFSAPSQVEGAAAAFAVESSLLQDPNQLAAGDPALGPGSNAGLSSLASLSDRFSNAAIDTMSNLGREVAVANRNESYATAKADTLASLRDSLSGVSIEEEMSRLSEYQRAAEASLQFVSSVDSMLEEMIRTL